MAFQQHASHIDRAQYRTDQKQTRYRGNKLIEALPPPLSDEELYMSLEFLPEFDPDSRTWEDSDRLRDPGGHPNSPTDGHPKLRHLS